MLFKKKYKLLLKPYFLISVTVIIVYAAFCLQICNKQGTAEISEELLQLWIPMVLSWIPVLIWLRPRIKLLKMKRDNRRSPDTGIMLIAAFSMMIPMMETSFYLEAFCGKLTHLDQISGIETLPRTEYYMVDTFFIDKQQRGLYYSSYTSGRFNSTLNFEIHIVCPIYDRKYNWYKIDTSLGIIAPPSATYSDNHKTAGIVFALPAIIEDTDAVKVDVDYKAGKIEDLKMTPSAWFGIHYSTSMGNLASDTKKKERESMSFTRNALQSLATVI